MLPMTLTVWVESLTHDRDWDRARDTQRIRDAFATLCRTVTQWPQPQHLLNVLPAAQRKGLTHMLPEVDPTHVPRAWGEIAEALRVPAKREEQPPAREKIDVEAIERGLREHYADAKTRAAGSDE